MNDMNIVKRMAAGIVHEIRNPITVIKGYTTMLKDSIGQKHFSIIDSQIEMIEQLLEGLDLLAKYDNLEKMNLNNVEVSLIIQNCLKELTPMFEASEVSLVIKCEKDHKIQCEEKLIRLLINNLLLNAVDSIVEGGVVSIMIGEYQNDFVQIQIEDTGTGITLERLPYIGQPFFSTKEKGIGMGLMLCRTIINKHSGSLCYYTELDKGTNVNIILPKHQPFIEGKVKLLH